MRPEDVDPCVLREVGYIPRYCPPLPLYAVAPKGGHNYYVARFKWHGLRCEVYLTTDLENSKKCAAQKIEKWIAERSQEGVSAPCCEYDVSEAGNELSRAQAGGRKATMIPIFKPPRPIVLDGGDEHWQDESLRWSNLDRAAVRLAVADLKDDAPTVGYGRVNEHAVALFVNNVVDDIVQMKGVRWFIDKWSSRMSNGTLLYVTDDELLWLRETLKRCQPPAFTDESESAVWDGNRDGILEEIRGATAFTIWRLRVR